MTSPETDDGIPVEAICADGDCGLPVTHHRSLGDPLPFFDNAGNFVDLVPVEEGVCKAHA